VCVCVWYSDESRNLLNEIKDGNDQTTGLVKRIAAALGQERDKGERERER